MAVNEAFTAGVAISAAHSDAVVKAVCALTGDEPTLANTQRILKGVCRDYIARALRSAQPEPPVEGVT
jgi:hypothetical protein